MKLILVVADTFQIRGRGLVVVPSPLRGVLRGHGEVEVELRTPVGACRRAVLTVAHEFQTPPPREPGWACIFRELEKAELPVGTEVLGPDEIFS